MLMIHQQSQNYLMASAAIGPTVCQAVSVLSTPSSRGAAELEGQCFCRKSRSVVPRFSAPRCSLETSISLSTAVSEALVGRSNRITSVFGRNRGSTDLRALKQMGVTRNELEDKPSVNDENVLGGVDIPVIDLSLVKSDREGVRKQLRDAAVEWGFFQVINHGIPLQDLQGLQSQGFQFFDLPIEHKLKAAEVGGRASFTPDNRKERGSALEWAESLMLTPATLDAFVRQVWPDGNAKFRDAVKKFYLASESLHERLLQLLAESLGLTTDFFSRHLNSRRTLMLRWNSYPPSPEASDVLGAVSHTDGCCMTVLQQDSVGGLQILKDRHWVTVAPIEGALVINVGDILHAWTNGLFKSVLHRVVVNKRVRRLSLAAFLGVDSNLIINAPEELIDEEHPRLYRPFGASDYINHILALRSAERSTPELKDGYVILEGFKLQK